MNQISFYIFLTILVNCFTLFSEDFFPHTLFLYEIRDDVVSPHSLRIEDNQIVIKDSNGLDKINSKFSLINKESLMFVKCNSDKEEEFLVLKGQDNLYMFFIDNKLKYVFADSSIENTYQFVETDFNSTSFLTEGKIKYTPNQLSIYKELRKPWGSGSGGKTGDVITMTTAYPIQNLFISNGYICTDNPALYKQNSRLKKIKIYNNTDEFVVELKDSPEIFKINMNYYDVPIKLEILEVYQGTKYNDICINFIVFEQRSEAPSFR